MRASAAPSARHLLHALLGLMETSAPHVVFPVPRAGAGAAGPRRPRPHAAAAARSPPAGPGARRWPVLADAARRPRRRRRRPARGLGPGALPRFLTALPPRRRPAVAAGLADGGELPTPVLFDRRSTLLPATARHAEAALAPGPPRGRRRPGSARSGPSPGCPWAQARSSSWAATRGPDADDRAAAYAQLLTAAILARDPDVLGEVLAATCAGCATSRTRLRVGRAGGAAARPVVAAAQRAAPRVDAGVPRRGRGARRLVGLARRGERDRRRAAAGGRGPRRRRDDRRRRHDRRRTRAPAHRRRPGRDPGAAARGRDGAGRRPPAPARGRRRARPVRHRAAPHRPRSTGGPGTCRPCSRSPTGPGGRGRRDRAHCHRPRASPRRPRARGGSRRCSPSTDPSTIVIRRVQNTVERSRTDLLDDLLRRPPRGRFLQGRDTTYLDFRPAPGRLAAAPAARLRDPAGEHRPRHRTAGLGTGVGHPAARAAAGRCRRPRPPRAPARGRRTGGRHGRRGRHRRRSGTPTTRARPSRCCSRTSTATAPASPCPPRAAAWTCWHPRRSRRHSPGCSPRRRSPHARTPCG